MTDRHISLDAAIGVVMEYFPCNTINDPKYAAGKSFVEALCALPVVGGWLDIESVPRDGTHVLLRHATGLAMEGWWSQKTNAWDVCHSYAGNDWIYWQPLPAPPEIE